MESDTAGDRWWLDYPMNVRSYDPIRYDIVKIRNTLSDASAGDVFSETYSSPKPGEFAGVEKVEAVSLRIIDIFDNQDVLENLCTSEEEAVAYFVDPNTLAAKRPKNHRIRIISIHSKKTTGPLLVTPRLLRKILAAYQVPPSFLQLLLSFKRNRDLVEHANNNYYEERQGADVTKIQYEIRYMEPSGRSGDDLVERHTGVFHDHQPGFDLFILLQSKVRTTAEDRIRHLKESSPNSTYNTFLSNLCKNPFQIHLLLFSSYILNWRPYLETLAQESGKRGNPAMVLTPGRAINFDQVQTLRNEQDKVISAKMNCTRTLSVLRKFQQHGNELKAHATPGLDFFIVQLEGVIDSFVVLEDRNRNAIALIDFILDRSIQEDTARVYTELNKHTAQVHALTKDSVKNNITVKVITFVSAFYLPGSFVATLFGMNFIGVNVSKTRITVTDDLWIFFLIWILLILCTLAVYLYIARFENRRQEKKDAAADQLDSSAEKGE